VEGEEEEEEEEEEQEEEEDEEEDEGEEEEEEGGIGEGVKEGHANGNDGTCTSHRKEQEPPGSRQRRKQAEPPLQTPACSPWWQSLREPTPCPWPHGQCRRRPVHPRDPSRGPRGGLKEEEEEQGKTPWLLWRWGVSSSSLAWQLQGPWILTLWKPLL